MIKWKKTALYILLFTAIVCTFAALFAFSGTAAAYTESVSLTSAQGDAFKSANKSFGENESFTFSATANFNGGHAAALTFGETDAGLWAFNADRESNSVKILYFTRTAEGYSAKEQKTDYFIGNGKMSAAERDIVNASVKSVESVHLKIVIEVRGGAAYLECYADGIRRFAYTDATLPAKDMDMNSAFEGYSYAGGGIGFNVCNADVNFTDIFTGATDDTYYTELYRNQLGFSQFAHWNNDPNGLVYYGGYYHLFYQHNPYAKVWGNMYWGHARSTDLLHWENLPICLFPERNGLQTGYGYNNGVAEGDGFMWSGTARVYHKGDSNTIDGAGWFDLSSLNKGDAAGLIAFYTRDGYWQDQMIASSDDGGLSWTKRVYVNTHGILNLQREPDDEGRPDAVKPDCRDPKVFEFGGGVKYGMLLTGMRHDDVWFLSSDDLVNWNAAGGFKARVPLVNSENTNGPECPDVAFFDTDGGKKCVITLSGRGYLVGGLRYEGGKFIFKADGNGGAGKDLSFDNPAEAADVKYMDFGPDSYATQTFYIDEGEYKDKTMSLSWFSGVPGASASVDSTLLTELRDKWNCGMTVPVIWGLAEDGGEYVLTQTPVTKDKDTLKAVIADADNLGVAAGENILKNIKSGVFDIEAEISNPEGGAVYFRVREGADEYTEIGWNAADGYYLDRTHTSDGNVILPAYGAKYRTKIACVADGSVISGGDGKNLSFYILVDDGGVQVFCGGGAAAFYAVTFSSPNSLGTSFFGENAVTFNKLKINEFSSGWRDFEDFNRLSVGSDNIELDLSLCTEKSVLVNGSGKIGYEIVSGGENISYLVTGDGLKIFAEKAGDAVIGAVCGDKRQLISVKVYGEKADSDVKFNAVKAGDWFEDDGGYIGKIKGGDAFLLSEREGADFFYSAMFDLKSGIAAALVFRASADMSDRIIVNYDHGAGFVKLWTESGDDYRAPKRLDSLNDIVLSALAKGNKIRVYLNGEPISFFKYENGAKVNGFGPVEEVALNDNAPGSGYFGLNVCAAEALFKCVSVTDDMNKDYAGGDIVWNHTDGSDFKIVNLDWNLRPVESAFYKVEGRKITLSQNYMSSLPEGGKSYTLEVSGKNSRYFVEIAVGEIPSAVWEDLKVQAGVDAVFFIGNSSGGAVKINGADLDEKLYKIDGMSLTVYFAAFGAGENSVSYGNLSAKVTVENTEVLTPHFNAGHWTEIITALFITVGVVIVAEVGLMLFIILKKKGKKDGGND